MRFAHGCWRQGCTEREEEDKKALLDRDLCRPFRFQPVQGSLYCKQTAVRQQYFGLWAGDSAGIGKGQDKRRGPAFMAAALSISQSQLCPGQFNLSSSWWLSGVTFD